MKGQSGGMHDVMFDLRAGVSSGGGTSRAAGGSVTAPIYGEVAERAEELAASAPLGALKDLLVEAETNFETVDRAVVWSREHGIPHVAEGLGPARLRAARHVAVVALAVARRLESSRDA